jgi:predicted enzyme related to lactoylglutathione lyase/SH3-like domain-containing protein
MARRRIAGAHTASHTDPISLRPDDPVAVGRRSEEWPAFLWCTGPDGRSGWVLEEMLSPAAADRVAVAAYDARELTVAAGEVVEVVETAGGWSLCRAADGRSGWVPDAVLGPEVEQSGITGMAGVLVFTGAERFPAMAEFYTTTLRLHPRSRREGFLSFAWGGVRLTLTIHDSVEGPAADPLRVMVNLAVDDIAAEHQRLSAAGVAFLRAPEREPWGGWVATFPDPDGNLLQLLQLPPLAGNMHRGE